MKQIFFTFILILMFCVFSFAQNEIKNCLKIKIVAPESIMDPDEPIYFSVDMKINSEKLISNIDVFSIDEYKKLSRDKERARLDNFLFRLFAEKDFRGIIHIRTDKNESNKSIKKYINFMMKYFKLREFPKERITFLIEKSDERRTTLWMFPQNFKFNLCEKCETLKGADL